MPLLMDDDGATIQAAGTLHYSLGGAPLTELAVLGRVETDGPGVLNGSRGMPAGQGPLPEPLLLTGYDTVAQKTRHVQPVLKALGADLWRVVIDRLVDRGLLHRKKSKVLGVYRSTKWLAADQEREAHLRARIRRVLEDGENPDPRTATAIGLLSASGALSSLRPPPPWTGQVATRAKGLERGD